MQYSVHVRFILANVTSCAACCDGGIFRGEVLCNENVTALGNFLVPLLYLHMHGGVHVI